MTTQTYAESTVSTYVPLLVPAEVLWQSSPKTQEELQYLYTLLNPIVEFRFKRFVVSFGGGVCGVLSFMVFLYFNRDTMHLSPWGFVAAWIMFAGIGTWGGLSLIKRLYGTKACEAWDTLKEIILDDSEYEDYANNLSDLLGTIYSRDPRDQYKDLVEALYTDVDEHIPGVYVK